MLFTSKVSFKLHPAYWKMLTANNRLFVKVRLRCLKNIRLECASIIKNLKAQSIFML